MSYDHELTVRFHEIDRAGIVYFARILEYCHVAYEEMLSEALGVSIEDHFQNAAWGMPLVHSEADYQQPCRVGDKLRVHLEVERVGSKSISFAYRVCGAEHGEQRASAKLIHAFIRLADFQPLPVPESLLQGLERLNLWPREAAD